MAPDLNFLGLLFSQNVSESTMGKWHSGQGNSSAPVFVNACLHPLKARETGGNPPSL